MVSLTISPSRGRWATDWTRKLSTPLKSGGLSPGEVRVNRLLFRFASKWSFATLGAKAIAGETSPYHSVTVFRHLLVANLDPPSNTVSDSACHDDPQAISAFFESLHA